jgi:hypothetical protein
MGFPQCCNGRRKKKLNRFIRRENQFSYAVNCDFLAGGGGGRGFFLDAGGGGGACFLPPPTALYEVERVLLLDDLDGPRLAEDVMDLAGDTERSS